MEEEETEFFVILENFSKVNQDNELPSEVDETATEDFWVQQVEGVEGVKVGEDMVEEEEIQPEQKSEVFEEESSSTSSWNAQEAELNEDVGRKKRTHAEKVRGLTMRRKLKQLDSFYKQKEHEVQVARQELNACQLSIEYLKKEQDDVEKEIEAKQADENIVAVFRLRAQHRRLCTELANEENLRSEIDLTLKQKEYELWQAEVEQGKFAQMRKEHQREDEILEEQRNLVAECRLEAEELALMEREHWRQIQEKNQMKAWMEQELRHQKAVEDAHKNHMKAVQFLKETMTRVRQKEAEEQMKTREEMKRRMKALHSLESNIETTKVRMGEEFEEQQKSQKVELLARIVQEEKYMEKREKFQARLYVECPKTSEKASELQPLKKRVLQCVEMTCGSSDEESANFMQRSDHWRAPSPMTEDEDVAEHSVRAFLDATRDSDDDETEKGEDRESLEQPEFAGLWEKTHKPYKVPKEEVAPKPVGGSKAEQEILARTLEKHRNGIIHRKGKRSRNAKGCPLQAKPSVIHFKDLDVGKTYKKKVNITNVTYCINFCKLVGVSENLKDFISMHFDPPGQLSAGMTCEMTVIFKPMVNEDLEGEVIFLAQSGLFSVPLRCSTKKCELSVDKELIDFGTHVVGETISRTITLTNRGALGTQFQLSTSADVDTEQLVAMEPSVVRRSSLDSVGTVSSSVQNVVSLPSFTTGNETEQPSRAGESQQLLSRTKSQQIQRKSASEKTEVTETGKDIFMASKSFTETESEFSLPESPLGAEEMQVPVEIKPGKMAEGDINPFSSVKIELIFTPTVPGKAQVDYEIIFANAEYKPIPIKACGVAVDVPIWLPNPNVDLKICMYDRLYQDSIIVHNRAKITLRLKFEVCKELRNHMELLPKMGYIQAQSSFSVQLKFLPRHSLQEDAGKYFDRDTGVLEVPMTVYVADQTRVVPFTVHAVVTTSDLEFDRTEVDFGYCSIHESVWTSVKLTNKSILPQEFGFTGLPQYIDVQPGDGFGTLLPLEMLVIDLIFKPRKANEYSFELTCKSGINRDFKLFCKAVGVHPPLELSHSLVKFAATAFNDVSTATLYVINSHTSRNQFSHQVPRIGKGEIAPVGPTSFEFLVPEDSPIAITPVVGTVMPGKKCKVQVSFHPTFLDQQIREEAVRLLCLAAEAKALQERQEAELANANKEAEAVAVSKKETVSAKKGKARPAPAAPKQPEKVTKVITPVPFEPPKPEEIKPDTDDYAAGLASLFRTTAGQFQSFIIPCFIATGETTLHEELGTLQYSPFNTLYLELHCPAVPPPVVVISDNGRNTIKFGEVAVGQTVKKTVTVQNISYEPLDLKSSILDLNGPFLIINALRPLLPGATHTLSISFTPGENKMFYETLEICSGKTTLFLNITGQGVNPVTACSEKGVIDMGYVLANDSATAKFTLQNLSSVAVSYHIMLASLSVHKHKDQQRLPTFLTPGRKSQAWVGTQNYSGLSVFAVSPVEGAVDPGTAQEFTVTFRPDHESLFYSDSLMVEVCEKPALEEHTKPILLTLESLKADSTLTAAVRELRVGCIQTALPQAKKSVEFSLDNVQALSQKGFTFDPVKASVEPGQRKAITITWTPPSGHSADQPIIDSASLTVKGDVTETYILCLTALIRGH
nr:PREDICTED: cilia- and flagella-associated protein 74 [Latimeria chalumnae]|eukprot:XP_014348852.1 PREDICTED: cilia- and flagella-associated protein 74 [Latimeria chalumnae]